MSIQDKILKKSDRFSRKLYNKTFKFSGNEARVIRLKIEEDRFGDETLIKIISHNEIIVNFSNLEEIPLSRLRKDLSQPLENSQQSLFLYDVLPIEVETALDSDLEKGDILIKKIYSTEFEDKPFFLTLRITESTGTFSPLSMRKIHYQCAPYIQSFSSEIIQLINSY